MNARQMKYLPLVLLLSGMTYAMDKEIKNIENTEAVEKKQLETLSKQTIVLTPEQSTIIHAVTEKENASSTPVEVRSESLGVVTGFKDWWYGEPSTVSHEIAHDTFDKNVPANLRRLSKAVEKETKIESPDNLKQLRDILDNCRTKEININDLSVLQLARKYAHEMRTKEEGLLTKEASSVLQNTERERTALLTELKKKYIEVIEKVNAIDKKLSEDLDSIHKKHGETIILGTEVKRFTRLVNDHIPADGYDSDTESKYDRSFNARKLGLDQPTIMQHKVNKRVVENLETLKNMVELADKQTIKAHGE